jgi:PilZ domain
MSPGFGSDRRESARLAVQIKAFVIVPKQFHSPATIIDLSVGGCQICLARPLNLPQRFVIQFNDTAYWCDRRWVKDANLGLQFIDLLSRAQRKELAAFWTTPRK